MLTIMFARSRDCVIGFRSPDDVPGPDSIDDNIELWRCLVQECSGKLYVDDDDEPRRPRKDGGIYSNLYGLHELDTWPEGLFEKLCGYTWYIGPENEINPLDVIVTRLGITK